MGGDSGSTERFRRDVDPFPYLVHVGVVDQVRRRVVDADAHVRLIEDLADLVADRIVDPLHVELGGERLLHAVDDREFRGALLALLEQPLRLVEEARVLQRHAHACGDGAQQPDLGFAVSVLALEILDVDRAEYAVTAQDGDACHRLASIRARNDTHPGRIHFGAAVLNERLPRLRNPGPRPIRGGRRGGQG